MPLYEVFHAIPLSRQQKDALADFITDLHSTTCSTPRMFVNVRFDQPQHGGDIYVGAKHRGTQVPNCMVANIRVGPSRPKELYDDMGLKIQKKWDEVVDDEGLGGRLLGHLTAKDQSLAKSLQGIVFRPFAAAIENGFVVPAAGDEAAWLKDNLAHFQKVADADDPDAKQLLQELSGREDVKQLLLGSDCGVECSERLARVAMAPLLQLA